MFLVVAFGDCPLGNLRDLRFSVKGVEFGQKGEKPGLRQTSR